ncbi:hypothetical protein DF185_06355 [Marinifilum breve]|uniref:BD-FAE-like domain-containing protein n=1 Tax=Marinifilum breve TaxID=2184082 RepID=A0A2V4A061_9BACT|nr:hypothetical protein [Marinifilum breve]PXY02265.1 hypothetical protein DF185_06355 [Marinifilum breve]
MNMKLFVAHLLVIVLFVSCKQDAKEIKKSSDEIVLLDHDPVVKSKNEMPKSLPILFRSGDHKLVGRVLMAHGSNAKPTVIFLHGNPGFEKNEETGQFLRRQGYNTVFFSYSGTWGNEGVFNYKNSIEDIKSLVIYLKRNAKYFRIDTSKISLCGHSMGADIAILGGKEIEGLNTIISIDPWDAYNALQSKSEEELNQYISNVEKRPCIKLSSGADFVNEIIFNQEMSLETALHSNVSFHIFSSKELEMAFKEHHKDIADVNIHVLHACDHSFSDKRMELAKVIIKSLQ